MSYRSNIIVLFLASTIATCFAQGNQGPKRWQDYVYPSNGFMISAPSAPDIHPDPEADDVTVYRWNLSPDVAAAIHVGDRPDCKQTVANLRVAAQNARGDLRDMIVKDVTLDGNAGLESTRKVGNVRYHEAVYCVGVKAYSITGRWPAREHEPAQLTRWFNSFHFSRGSYH